jgi:hypothetical protein
MTCANINTILTNIVIIPRHKLACFLNPIQLLSWNIMAELNTNST